MTFQPLPPINNAFSNKNEVAISVSEEKRNEPRRSSPRSEMLNRKLGEVLKFFLSRVYTR